MLKYFLILQVYRVLFKIESYVLFKGIKQNICNRKLFISGFVVSIPHRMSEPLLPVGGKRLKK